MNEIIDESFGKLAKDKITGFEGIVIGKCTYIYGCSQYALAPQVDKDGKRREIEWFDEGRIETIADCINLKSVQADKNGCEYNIHPKKIYSSNI